MYLVTIVNNNIETVINHVSTNNKANRISGTIKQGINCINSFTFTIYPNNEGYNLINPLSTQVKVLNTKTNKYEFIGRVLSPTHSMSSSGLVSKSYICESELAYLLDTYQSYEEVHNITVRGYLERLIRVHNANTDSNKQFTVGNVNVIDNNDSLYRYVAYDTTKKNIDDDLIDKLGGELQIRYENDIRYLDYLKEIGKVCTTEIRLAKNLQDIEQNIDVSGYCNRLVVLGSKLKTTDDEGNEVDLEERLTIESVNNGVRYIDDEESINKFGVIQGQVIFDDVTDAKNLFSKGKKYLLNQRILISNKVTALDLSLIGIDIDSFEVGNYYPLIHEILNINDTVRIVEKTISIDNPHTSTITLGDLEKDIKKYNIQAKKGYAEAMKIAEEASNRVVSVEKYTTEQIYRVDGNINTIITDVGKEITNINNSLGSTSNDLTDINSNITILTNQVNKNTSDINNIESVLDNIELDIVTVKADLNILKADTTTINNKLDEILSILNGGA
jgi:prophage lp1 protein 52, endolysin